jgi:hypothetical protein
MGSVSYTTEVHTGYNPGCISLAVFKVQFAPVPGAEIWVKGAVSWDRDCQNADSGLQKRYDFDDMNLLLAAAMISCK